MLWRRAGDSWEPPEEGEEDEDEESEVELEGLDK